MRIVFTEIYYEIRFFYYFLSLLGFKVFYFKLAFLKNVENLIYLKSINELKAKNINYVDLIEESNEAFNFEHFDNDFEGTTVNLNQNLLNNDLIKKLYKSFKINISFSKFEIYMQSILQGNIQRQFHIFGSQLNYWFKKKNFQNKTFIIITNLSNFFINIENKNVSILYLPLNNILNFYFKVKLKLKIFFDFKNKNKNKNKIKNNIFYNFFSKYVYIFHNSTNYSNLFNKELFFFEDKKKFSQKEISSVLYTKNSENLFDLSKVSVFIEYNFYLKSFIFFLKLTLLNFSFKNIAVKILFTKIYFRYLRFEFNLNKFKNLEAAFIDWDTQCPKELIMALESKKIKTICAQERIIQSQYKYFYNIICDIFLSSSLESSRALNYKPYTKVKKIIEFGNYREDFFFDKKNDKIIQEKYNLKTKEKLIIIFSHHTGDASDNFNNILTNWKNHLFFLEETFSILSNKQNIKVVYRFKNINWMANNTFKNILNKIENSENFYIDKEYSKSFFSYSLARNADIVIGPHSSILDELIEAKFDNLLIFDYGYKIKSIIEKLKYQNSTYLCKNSSEFNKKLNFLLNKMDNKLFKNNQIKQKFSLKNKLLNILNNEL